MKKYLIIALLIFLSLNTLCASNYFFNRDSSGIYQKIGYFDSGVDFQDLSYSIAFSYKGRFAVGLQYDFIYDYISSIVYFPDSDKLLNQVGLDLDYALLKQTPTSHYGPGDQKFISINLGAAIKTNEIASTIAGKISFTHKRDWGYEINSRDIFDPHKSLILGLLIDLEFYDHKRLYTLPVSSFALNYSLEGTMMLNKFCISTRVIWHITDISSDQYAFREYYAFQFNVGYLIPIRIKKRIKKNDFKMDIYNSGTE